MAPGLPFLLSREIDGSGLRKEKPEKYDLDIVFCRQLCKSAFYLPLPINEIITAERTCYIFDTELDILQSDFHTTDLRSQL